MRASAVLSPRKPCYTIRGVTRVRDGVTSGGSSRRGVPGPSDNNPPSFALALLLLLCLHMLVRRYGTRISDGREPLIDEYRERQLHSTVTDYYQ